MKTFNFLVLVSSLFCASCTCNNSDILDIKAEPKGVEKSSADGPKHEEKKEKPEFILTLAEGVEKEKLFVNRPIPLVLKDDNFSNHGIATYNYPNQDAGKGDLHFMDVAGKAGKRVEPSDIIELKDGVFPLVFVPNGKLGKDTIRLKFISSNNKVDYLKVRLEVDLKSIISLETPEEVKTSQQTKVRLKIDADPKEEFTLKSVRSVLYPAELSYENGETEGGGEEVKPVRIGDKFKGGEHALSLYLYGQFDKVDGGEVFEGVDPTIATKSIESMQYNNERGLEVVLEDNEGNQYTTVAKFKVDDISFDFDLDVNYYPTIPNWGEGTTEVEGKVELILKFKKKDELGNNSSEGKHFEVLSLRSNDGSAVSLVNYGDEKLVGHTFEGKSIDITLYFRFDEMTINLMGKSTILTLKIEGPGGVIRSADLEVTWQHRQLILLKRIENISKRAYRLHLDLDSYNEDDWSTVSEWQRINELGPEVVAFLEEVKLLASQAGDPKLFSKYLAPEIIDEMLKALEEVNNVKKDLEEFNTKFGFNFQSPI